MTGGLPGHVSHTILARLEDGLAMCLFTWLEKVESLTLISRHR